VLDPVHEILDGGPCITAVRGKDCLNRIEFWLLGCCGRFGTHWAQVSVPPIEGGCLRQIVGKPRPWRVSFVL
jgi:hypothetical protein